MSVSRKVYFCSNAKYTLPGIEQEDRNKLFGLTYGNVKRLSARFGWRYSPEKNRFILSAYCHFNGELQMGDICELKDNTWYDCHIINTGPTYIFRVMDENGEILCTEHISTGHRRKWAFLLGLFFGGNWTSPHNIDIKLKKI